MILGALIVIVVGVYILAAVWFAAEDARERCVRLEREAYERRLRVNVTYLRDRSEWLHVRSRPAVKMHPGDLGLTDEL
jgi:hypothetical protein